MISLSDELPMPMPEFKEQTREFRLKHYTRKWRRVEKTVNLIESITFPDNTIEDTKKSLKKTRNLIRNLERRIKELEEAEKPAAP